MASSWGESPIGLLDDRIKLNNVGWFANNGPHGKIFMFKSVTGALWQLISATWFGQFKHQVGESPGGLYKQLILGATPGDRICQFSMDPSGG